MNRLLQCQVVLATLALFLVAGCGGGGGGSATNPVPVVVTPAFTSTPVTQAVEGSAYSYQLAVSGAAAVTFSLSTAPTGASISGNTISWTPTTQQSRAPNNFTVTATASGGGSATQSWTVTPSGTIRISRIDTSWSESGSTNTPFDWSSLSSYVAAVVPQADGSFQTLSGTAGANGTFQIPNVPAGYFWLKLGPRDIYWTSSSTFDLGGDSFVPIVSSSASTTSTTYINFNFTSLDATPASGQLRIDSLDSGGVSFSSSTTAGSNTFTGLVTINSNIDFSLVKNAFVTQYEPASFGTVNGYVSGPELTLSNLLLTTGGQNTMSGSLNPKVPASINLSVQNSAWTPLFNHISATAPTATGGGFYLSVQPYVPSDAPNVSVFDTIDLISTRANLPGFVSLSCTQNPPLTADVDAGAVQYSDPFPAAWRRTFRVCQAASVTVPVPGDQPQSINLVNTQMTSLPTATVKPLLSAAQNPKINGADLFTASTISSAAVTLSWDAPAIGTPFGYQVAIMSPITGLDGHLSYSTQTILSTAKTSLTLPPSVVTPGKTYLFVITSLTDGKANMETSPRRSSLPAASAQVMSAPITTN